MVKKSKRTKIKNRPKIAKRIKRSYKLRHKNIYGYYTFYIYKIDTQDILAVYYNYNFIQPTKKQNRNNILNNIKSTDFYLSDYIVENTVLKLTFIKRTYYIRPKNKNLAKFRLDKTDRFILSKSNSENRIIFETKLSDLNLKKIIAKIKRIITLANKKGLGRLVEYRHF
jgi:hypothetical protein